ncbi:MAG: 16S rRNA (cytosine(1402)-N(4))-methyltransferase RsmH [Lentisphaeria bacterium]|nr:16S rRNA (cytosine(1402)-N(4))-methyltransferase RsmH [Lentisphaeria bacterium]
MSTPENPASFTHIPVLPQETIRFLTDGKKSGRFRMIDCTLGRGGHSSMVLRQNPDAEILALDRDSVAIAQSAKVLEFAAERVFAVQTDFAGMKDAAGKIGWDQCDAVLMDLGVSSPQIDDPSRGFSFRFNGPLDMRMDTSSPLTASRVLNTYEEEDLERIFRVYGELRESRSLARAIVTQRRNRPFSTTGEAGAAARLKPPLR